MYYCTTFISHKDRHTTTPEQYAKCLCIRKCAFHACWIPFFLGGVLCVIYTLCVIIETLSIDKCADSIQLPFRSGCNGVDELCNKPYNEVSYATIHNAFANTQNGFLFAQHRGCMRSALVHGIRGFMLDVHITKSRSLKLCHSACWMGSSSLPDTLEMFAEFRRLNPREIVTIFIEAGFDNHATVDDALKREFQLLLLESFEKSGLTPFMIEHKIENTTWPSLSTMISIDKQIVVVVDAEKFCQGAIAPWFYCMTHFVTQTNWSLATGKALTEACEFYTIWKHCAELTMINHFTTIAALGINTRSTQWFARAFSVPALEDINRHPFFQDRVVSCSKCLDRFINFVVVDFWESSGVVEITDILNKNNQNVMKKPHQPDAAFCVNSTKIHNTIPFAVRCNITK